MSELSFLIDLLINQKLSKPVKALLVDRIKELETKQTKPPITVERGTLYTPPPVYLPPHIANQSPSTIANFIRNPPPTELVDNGGGSKGIPGLAPHPDPEVIVASPQAAAAIQSRRAAINAAISAKPEMGRTSPRKF